MFDNTTANSEKISTQINVGQGAARLVQRLTEQPGMRNADGSSTPMCGEGFHLPESTFSADSFTVSLQPPYAIACVNISANPKRWQPYHCLDIRKYCRYSYEWLVIALLLRLLYLPNFQQGREQINEVLKKKKKRKRKK